MLLTVAPAWKSNSLFRVIFIWFMCVKKLGYLTCRSVMPCEKFERVLVLKHINMEGDLTQNNSRAELVYSNGENVENPQRERTLKDVKLREWIMVLILCFVNLINYMDRFTLAGILEDIQKYFHVQNDKGGLLQTAFVLSYMIFAPIFGYLGDRYSRKNIMAFGVFLWSITTLIGSFMQEYWFFLLFRALVGIGEASYSTIAPTIISDLFVGDVRSKMLALFYFAIPVGSGLGYIVGSETARVAGKWQWGLRVTPVLGVVAVVLIFFVLRDPERGQSEGSSHIQTTSWSEDLRDIIKNRSFMTSTAAFTCVTFVAGALAWWGPKFIEKGLKLQQDGNQIDTNSVSYKFGVVSMASGILGVPCGSLMAQRLRHRYPRVDAYLCAVGLFLSTPMVFFACLAASYSSSLCFTLVFLGEFFLNLTWSIVADILLYVVLPTRRSTAEGFQLLVSHALGDAGSPYLIGVMSEAILIWLNNSSKSEWNEFKALQYALFTTCFVEILGAFFFLINALYILQDKHKVEKTIQEYPGSNHDSYIWRNSAVRNGFEEGAFPEGWLVGDSGYPQEPWLMTPVGNANSAAEHLYNSVHISTRNPIERTNGVLKSRWRVLNHPLAYEPGKVCQIITACCVLHNICTEYNLDVEDFEEHPLPDDFPCQEAIPANFMDVRRDLIVGHFTR